MYTNKIFKYFQDFELAINEAGDMVKPNETDQVKLRYSIFLQNMFKKANNFFNFFKNLEYQFML